MAILESKTDWQRNCFSGCREDGIFYQAEATLSVTAYGRLI